MRDPRASLMVAETDPVGDPLDSGRVTLAGRVEAAPTMRPARPTRTADACTAASPTSRTTCCGSSACAGVGGYGRMDSTDAAAYHAAEPYHLAFAMTELLRVM